MNLLYDYRYLCAALIVAGVAYYSISVPPSEAEEPQEWIHVEPYGNHAAIIAKQLRDVHSDRWGARVCLRERQSKKGLVVWLSFWGDCPLVCVDEREMTEDEVARARILFDLDHDLTSAVIPLRYGQDYAEAAEFLAVAMRVIYHLPYEFDVYLDHK
jgi:hypothetical protein